MEKTAEQRGKELYFSPLHKIPHLAKLYAMKFCHEFSWSREDVIKAYAHYAQIVEGLPCEDKEFQITKGDIARFHRHDDDDAY